MMIERLFPFKQHGKSIDVAILNGENLEIFTLCFLTIFQMGIRPDIIDSLEIIYSVF